MITRPLLALFLAAGLLAPAAGPVQAAVSSAAPAQRLEEARRLTWQRDTRAAGVAALRQLHQAHPADGDVTEALADVLTWDDATRPEGIRMLRELLAADPQRQGARLKLAEVLSWSREGRGEAEALYRSALERDPGSVPARVGLARLLSWQGDLGGSRMLYEEALAREPGDPAARLGLAEVQRWSGRSRASLRTLASLPGEEARGPGALRREAEAYRDLDRPARALAGYEALLALDPSDEQAGREAERLRRRLRPRLEMGLAGSTESGDPLTSKLRTLGVPVVFSWYPQGDLQVKLRTGATVYDNRRGSTLGRTLGAGLETPAGNRVRLRLDLDGHDFEDGGEEFTGRAEVQVAPLDRLQLRAGVARDLLLDSRLSAAGEEIGGVRYGPVTEREAFVGIGVRPGRAWDVSLRVGRGRLEGDALADNHRETAFLGAGRTFRRGNLRLRPGYSLTWLAYDLDLGGFPPAALAGDGLASRGAGGYFSPFRFLNQMLRLDAALSRGDGWDLYAGGGVGRQQVEDVGSPDFDRTDLSSDVYLGARWRLGASWEIRGEVSRQDVAAAFDRTRAGIFLVRLF